MRRERVAQGVRRELRRHIRFARIAFDDVPELLARHRVAARGHEHRVGRARAENLAARLAQVARQPIVRLLAERHEPLLEPLAHRAYDALVETDLDRLQIDELRHAQTARVHEFEHRSIAQPERRFDVGGVEQRFDLRLRECRRHPHRLLGREQTQCRIGTHAMLAQRPGEKAPKHG